MKNTTKTKPPTSPCSVVWYDGHPWVLDGEPGISRHEAPRRWVGMLNVKDADGTVRYVPGSLSEAEMSEYGPAIIYVDTYSDDPNPTVKTKGQR